MWHLSLKCSLSSSLAVHPIIEPLVGLVNLLVSLLATHLALVLLLRAQPAHRAQPLIRGSGWLVRCGQSIRPLLNERGACLPRLRGAARYFGIASLRRARCSPVILILTAKFVLHRERRERTVGDAAALVEQHLAQKGAKRLQSHYLKLSSPHASADNTALDPKQCLLTGDETACKHQVDLGGRLSRQRVLVTHLRGRRNLW
mmetsp:Transcript_32800/g.86220  ORF Transcript_32800/g.86220 Transcript_32800/m.86220 type:complete len:202 (-) Transcript_32800:685-1290(-)